MACQPIVSYANPRDIGELAEPLRSRVAKMINDAPTHGLILISGKRTDYQQWLLRHERCPGQECDSACKGHPTTALPGHSNHRNLDAQHCAADLGGRDLDWAGRNEARYGLNRPVSGEKWHFEPNGNPTVPIPPWDSHGDPNAGHVWLPFDLGDTDRIIFGRNGFDNEVAEVQWRLASLGGRLRQQAMVVPVDGSYGRRSAEAVGAFKLWVIDMQAPGHKWRNAGPFFNAQHRDVLRFWTP